MKNVVCEYIADAVHRAKLFKGGVFKIFKRSKPLNQVFCRLFAYAVNAERENKSVKRGFFGFLDRIEQVGDLFVAESVKSEQVGRREIEKIYRVFKMRFVVELLGGFFTETVYIHSVL